MNSYRKSIVYCIGFCMMLLCVMALTSCNSKESKSTPVTERPTEVETKQSKPPQTLFNKISKDKSGILFRNDIKETAQLNYLKYLYAYNGGGVAVGDINNDGLEDLFFSANMLESKLYLNKGGLQFQDITKEAGIKYDKSWSTGVTFADVNGDGFLDLYVCKSGPENYNRSNLLYINNGDQTFSEESNAFGLDIDNNSTQAVFFDYDLDGDLDAYIVSHLLEFPKRYESQENTRSIELEYSDRLLRNDHNKKFVDVTKSAGVLNSAFGLNASIADFDQNGLPDIYVTCDFSSPDFLYINQGNGRFSSQLKESMRHISQYSMGSDAADINNDGLVDLMTVDMSPEDNFRSKMMMGAMQEESFRQSVEAGNHYQYMYNSVQLNNGNAKFSEIGMLSNMASTDWSWCPLIADFDNDGKQDVFVTNGVKRDVLDNDYRFRITQKTGNIPGDRVNVNVFEALDTYQSNKLSNYAFRNEGSYTFSNTSKEWGLNEPSFSNGAAYADLDNDGDLDLVINNVDDFASLYENTTNLKSNINYLKVKLDGIKNRFGIGAEIQVVSKGRSQYKQVGNSRGYLSASSNVLCFGIGRNEEVEKVIIKWPGGHNRVVENVEINQLLVISESDGDKFTKVKKASSVTFKEIKVNGLNYTHSEKPFNDMSRETLIPHKTSSNGPFVVKADVNGDSLEDVFIGGSYGFSGALFIQKKNGSFSSISNSTFESDKYYEDTDACFFDLDNDGDKDLYIVSGSNEFEVGSDKYTDRLYLNDGKGNFIRERSRIPTLKFNGSCVVAHDYDGDNDVDLFVGGHSIPGKYGKPSKSILLKNDNGTLKDVTELEAPQLSQLGMTKDAVWVNIDADEQKELIVVGEWMPITVLDYNGSAFQIRTSQFGLDHTSGWWNAIKAVDIDADGDEDFIVGNLGLNYKYKASNSKPFNMYLSDFDKNGSDDIVLSYYQKGFEYPVRGRNCTMQQMPIIQKQFPNYTLFAQSDIQKIYGQKLQDAKHLKVQMFESVVIENRGNGQLKINPLPNGAQKSSVNDIVCHDFNKDGKLDVLVGGNLYDSEAETPRADASYGVLLQGQGNFKFRELPQNQSNLFLEGEIQSLNLIKNIRGKDILVAGANSAKLKFYNY